MGESMQEINARYIQLRISKLHDLRPLDRGGQKVVFSGVHEDYGRVVVKLVTGSQPDERVRREIEVATTCRIPNTARLYEWGTFEQDDVHIVYIVEEFISGITLRQQLTDKGRLSKEIVLGLVGALLETAVATENENIVHRDIKPENIMVCPDGTFKVIDFGIARHLSKTSITPTEAHFGPHTAGYAAPEQFRNLKKEIDIRADLFAIGVVAYEALSGRHPFADGARDRLDILRRTESIIPDVLEVEEDRGNQLTNFITVLMEKYPSRRPPTAHHAQQWFDTIRRAIYDAGD